MSVILVVHLDCFCIFLVSNLRPNEFIGPFLLQEPFNAEPPRSALVSSYMTPVDFFYKRNHGPIPIVDDIERYVLPLFISSFIFLNYRTVWSLSILTDRQSVCMGRYCVSVTGLIDNPKQLFMKDIW
ncbi:hypothetical protein CsSME_00004662 [Camellia sinensis var. sinensis]